MSSSHGGNVAFFVPHAGCPHACSFCDQRAVTGEAAIPTPDEVRGTLTGALARMGERAARCEIAFFGGSFTAIDPVIRRGLLAAAAPFVGPGRFAGVRVSTRPDAVDDAVLDELCAHGGTTVELGAQSMDDAVLARNRRGHTARQVEEAAALVKRRGLRLGLQMMTGLPGDSDEGARRTAARIAALEPDCVRVYPALTLRGTGLEAELRAGRYTPPDLEATIELCADLLAFFADRNIPVIRLGLQDEPGLRAALAAGPHHPALRERCESRLLLRAATARIAGRRGPLLLRVHPSCVSRMTGQRRENLDKLAEAGVAARVLADDSLPPMTIEIDRVESTPLAQLS